MLDRKHPSHPDYLRPIEVDEFDTWSLERQERRANRIAMVLLGSILLAVAIVWWWRS